MSTATEKAFALPLSNEELADVSAACRACDNYVGPGTYEDYIARQKKSWKEYWQRQADNGNDAGTFILTGERPQRPS